MTDISKDAVERLTPHGLVHDNGQVEAVMEARKNGKYVLYSEYAARMEALDGAQILNRNAIRRKAARIDQLEAEREALIVARDMMGRKWSTAREDALRDAADRTMPDDPNCECDICVALVQRSKAILALINKEPKP